MQFAVSYFGMSLFTVTVKVVKKGKERLAALLAVISWRCVITRLNGESGIMPRSDKAKKENKKEREEAKRLEQEKFWRRVDELLVCQTPGTEIAGALKISPNCLYERCKFQKGMDWSVYSQSGNDTGKSILRVSQFKKAVKEKSCTMQIHLGKHWLGQTDRQVVITEEHTTQKSILSLPDNGRRIVDKGTTDEE